jgi:hypothetical protein
VKPSKGTDGGRICGGTRRAKRGDSASRFLKVMPRLPVTNLQLAITFGEATMDPATCQDGVSDDA